MQLDKQAQIELQERFIFKSLLGKGSFGYVYQCEDLADNQIYAVKVISKSNVKKNKIQSLRQQANILSNINHPNIVKVYDFEELNTCIYLKMEIIRGGNLELFMKKKMQKGLKFSDDEIARIMGSIFRSVNHIHSVSIIHRDIKPQNILLPSEHKLDDLKMADFGLSTKLDFYYPKSATIKCGTMLYMAPEILCNYAYTKSVDIWSCSIIMFMLFKGKHPFYQPKMTSEDYKKKIKTIVFPPLQNSLAQDFIAKISKVQPNQRYCTQQALRHPWLTRQFDDQIPLSLHQSFAGFEKSHQISHVIKVFLTLKEYFAPLSAVDIPSDYKDKVQNETRNLQLKLKKKISRNNSISANSLNDIQMLFGKRQQPKERIHKKSAQFEAQSPTIIKLNKIFNNLFDKKSKKDKINTDGLTLHPEPQENTIETPQISEYKQHLEKAIEMAVIDYKGILKPNTKKRILPLKKNNLRNKETEDLRVSSDSFSSNGSNRVRYRKRIGPAIKDNQ